MMTSVDDVYTEWARTHKAASDAYNKALADAVGPYEQRRRRIIVEFERLQSQRQPVERIEHQHEDWEQAIKAESALPVTKSEDV